MDFGAVKDGNSTAALEAALIAQAEQSEKTILKLNSTHSVLTGMFMPEIRFNADMTIAQVKEEFAYRYGSLVENQQLQLKDSSGNLIAAMDDHESTLKNYGA